MEPILDTVQEQQPIADFTSMSAEELESLITRCNLRMSLRDLRYCQNQYRMRERRNPSAEELKMLDALYNHRIQQCAFHGLRTFNTSDPLVAQSYADMIAKASHTRREDRPYTPAELSRALTASLKKAGKKISVPTLFVGQNPSARLAENGLTHGESAVINGMTAVIGAHGSTAHAPSQPQPSDHFLLISPAHLSPASFGEILSHLSIPNNAQLIFVGSRGLLDALLTWDGLYIIPNHLPGMQNDMPLSHWITSFTDSVIVRCSGDDSLTLRDQAASMGLTASIIGRYATNQHLTIRRDEQAPIQIETAFLRTFSPLFPTDVEIPNLCTQDDHPCLMPHAQTVIRGGDSSIFASAIPNTAYALSQRHLLTGAASYSSTNTFRSAMFTTAYAVNRAVAAGVDHLDITLSNHLRVPALSDRNQTMSEMMTALLGAYRVQSELAIPDVNSIVYTETQSEEKTNFTVAAAAPKPERVVSPQFKSAGSNVYLLTPLASESSPIDFEDYRKLLRYVHHLCQNGIALSALAIYSDGVEHALRIMSQSGIGFSSPSTLPSASFGFLIETQQPIQGMLMGITTASPIIRIGEKEIPIENYAFPHISANNYPMSDIGVETPILCIPQTASSGSCTPLRAFADQQHVILQTPLLSRPESRAQLTAFANSLLQSHIAVLVGSADETAQILANPRVAYAKQELLKRGGLLLCLQTDPTVVKNQYIPPNHPFFFGIPKILYDRSAIRFEDDHPHFVCMSADSPAVPAMLACAIAYFK